jgi:uncharacterized protein
MELRYREMAIFWGIALLIAIGLLGGGFFVGNGFYMSRMADRYVTVKGLAEKDVVADLAVWNIKLAATGDVLADVQANIERQRADLMAFLQSQGIADAEIGDGQLSVVDLMAQQYRQERAEQSRFIINFAVTMRSNDVQKVKAVSGRVGDLVRKGLVLADNAGPSYIFTKLNEIKPEMIAAATRSARQAAEQFAADSGSRVGSIRRASQGIFSIEARDGAPAESMEGMPMDAQARQIEKKVRVVSTIDYSLAN